eukprot:Hpha_TRINITY_DN16256_c0_g2::TRINITY_DN16256_c0_g2_i1::g.11561::m.11561
MPPRARGKKAAGGAGPGAKKKKEYVLPPVTHPDGIDVGVLLVVHSLETEPELNGQKGRCIGFQYEDGVESAMVHFGAEVLLLFMHNLKLDPSGGRVDMRIDEADGSVYTKKEFLDFYGPQAESKWDTSEHPEPRRAPEPPKAKPEKPKPKEKKKAKREKPTKSPPAPPPQPEPDPEPEPEPEP